MSSSTERYTAISVFILITLLTVLCYQPGLSGDYMFDDSANLLENQRLNIGDMSVDSLMSAAHSSGAGPLRRPVSMLSFALNRYFFGIDPYSHKVINLVTHLLTGFGLYLLTRLLLTSYRETHKPEFSNTIVIWLPVVISGLWLVHPLNLTSVLYIVQRMTSLAALFTVCGLCLYVIGRRRMWSGKTGMPLILIGFLAFGGLAILSKETGALLPLYMIIIEMAVFRFRNRTGVLDKSVIGFFLATLAIPVCLFLLYVLNNPEFVMRGYNVRDFTLTERLLTEARVLVFYLKLIIIPSITELGLYHDDIPLSHGLLNPPSTLYSLGVLASLVLGAILLLRKRPLVGLGILWFFTGHLLESTVMPLEIAHEHRNYLADFGIILAISSAVAQAPSFRLTPVIQKVVPLILILLFISTTWLRSSQWSDNINHAVYEAMHHPESARANFAAGRIHARLALAGETGSDSKAERYLEKAGLLDKGGILPELAMIKMNYLLDKPVNPAWFDRMLFKLEKYPIYPSDLQSLEALAECIGVECDMPHEILESMFQLALKDESAQLLTIYGYYKINKQGDFAQGLQLFNRAVERFPHESQLWVNLIELLIVMKRFDDAENKLMLFKTSNSRPGHEMDYDKLQQAIDRERKADSSSALLGNPENS